MIIIDIDNNMSIDAFASTIDKANQVANIWYLRTLTLMGRVLVINKLIESLFVHKCTVLCNMSKNQICKLYEIISRFLWKGRRSKIPLHLLQKSKNCGGLRLVDLEAKQDSLKIQWVANIADSKFLQAFVYDYLFPVIKEYIWVCNLEANDVVHIISVNSFWRQVLFAWWKRNYKDPQSAEEVLEQVIWLNSGIKVNNKLLLYEQCIKQGIYTLDDLYDRGNCRFLDYEQFRQKYVNANLCWIDYIAILDAIPKVWRLFIRNEVGQIGERQESLWESICARDKVANFMYRSMIYDQTAIIKYVRMWNERLQCTLMPVEFLEFFDNLYKISNSTKLRDFQYRLLLGKVYTNKVLFHWGIAPNKLCTFCKQEEETVLHLIVECPQVQQLWNCARELAEEMGVRASFGVKEIIFNTLHVQPKHLLNCIALHIKQFIYRCKCQQKKPLLGMWTTEFDKLYAIEYYNASIENRLSKHMKKWSPLYPELCDTNDSETDFTPL